jgi:hypothetical protein
VTALVDSVMLRAEVFLAKHNAGFSVGRDDAFHALVRCNWDTQAAWEWTQNSFLLKTFRALLADGQTWAKAAWLEEDDEALLKFLEKHENNMARAVALWRESSDTGMAFVGEGFGLETTTYPAGPDAIDDGAPATGPPSDIAVLQQLSGGTGVPLSRADAQAALEWVNGDVEMAWLWLRQQADVNTFLNASGWFGGASRGNRDLAERVLDVFQWDLLAALENWQDVTGDTSAGAWVPEDDEADDEDVEAGAFEQREERMQQLGSQKTEQLSGAATGGEGRDEHPKPDGWWHQGRAALRSQIRRDPLNSNTAPPDTAPLASRGQLADSGAAALEYATEVARFVGGGAVCMADFIKAMDLYNAKVCRWLPLCPFSPLP